MRTGFRTHAVVGSPVGPLTLVAVDGGLAGLYMIEQRHLPPPGDADHLLASEVIYAFGRKPPDGPDFRLHH
jgi:hypothetical protein